MASTVTIPQFLLPRGISHLTLRYAAATVYAGSARGTFTREIGRRALSSSSWKQSSSSTTPSEEGKPRVLAQPDKFRPPSHPARRVLQTRNGKIIGAPYNYPGPPLSEKEKEEQKKRRYPNMFPPEGTVMHKFLTTRWIHVWIAMGVLTSLATFTFTENFKRTSPFAHLLPPWSGLLTHPIDTISQALTVYKMHVEHTSRLTREKRHRRIEDAEKRRQYRIAHGLEEPDQAGSRDGPKMVDDQSPVAPGADQPEKNDPHTSEEPVGEDEFRDFEGKRRKVKKWLGIW
ncbi:hypothetical protein VTN77DRAFT_5631 [Rasamsonia byssochlamydoides]|uniref:uncharacterized protein n=1 Tax=Rasamsonia byssochlamydoides TaxID=89139 RepID=UPI0037429CFB